MESQKIVITYKRKRFSTQGDFVHAIKEDKSNHDSLGGISLGRLQPEAELHGSKANEDIQNKLQYPSTQTQDSEGYMHPQVIESKRAKISTSIETSELEPMKLRSKKVLSRKLADKGSRKASPSPANACVSKMAVSSMLDSSCDNAGSPLKIPHNEGSSKSALPDLDGTKSSPVCLNSSPEKKRSSGCSDSTLKTFTSDNMLLNKVHLKERTTTPMITFYRRMKKKQITLEASAELNKPPKESIFKDQRTTAIILEEANVNTLHGLQHDVVANADKDLTLELGLAESFTQAKNASDKLGGSSFPHEEPSSNLLAPAPKMEALGTPILTHEDKQHDLTGFVPTSKEQLTVSIDISGRVVTPHNTSEDRCQITDLNLSAIPPLSACANNETSNKPADVVPENLLESQSSSTPSCAVVLDEEVDGRGKELEWLESLGKSLQEAKENKNTGLLREQDDNNCGSSSGWASALIPSKSPVRSPSNQDENKDYTRQIDTFPERTFLSLSCEPNGRKEHHQPKSNISSQHTNFLDLSLPCNSEGHIGCSKDFQNIPFGLKESDGDMNSGQVPWYTSSESSILFRHKKIVEDVITGTRMLKERQGSFLDKYSRYSNEWSEDELDFLWIGVRRYGLYNWSAMLRDPKLRFSELRVAEDLARRWDLEQRKMFSTPLVRPATMPIFSSSQAYSEPPTARADTKLSLGDWYQKETSFTRSICTSGVTTTSTVPFFAGSDNPIPGIRQQKPTRSRNTKSLWEPFILRPNSCENPSLPSSAANLPHWLKPVVGAQFAAESALPPASTASQPTNPLNNGQQVGVPVTSVVDPSVPPKETRRRGLLKRKGVASRTSDALAALNEPWTGSRLGLGLPSQKAVSGGPGPIQRSVCDLNRKVSAPIEPSDLVLNRKVSAPIEPSDLVVIDSDASSEETISDDQGSRF